MDKHRGAMPWLTSDDGFVPPICHEDALERFESQTKYCSACSGAHKSFVMAAFVVGMLIRATGTALVMTATCATLRCVDVVTVTRWKALVLISAVLLAVIVMLVYMKTACN